MNAQPSPDDRTLRLGLLMEAAQSQQQLAQDSLQRLHSHALGLDALVREEIRRCLVAEIGEVTRESARAAAALRSLQRSLTARVMLWGSVVGAIPGLALIAILTSWLPAPTQLAALRAQREQLRAEVARLDQSGARLELRHCGADARLCVRVETATPRFGPQADFVIAKGY